MKFLQKLKQVFFMSLFRLFPIHENQIVFMSYYGKQTNCNPFSIYEEIKKNNLNYECVWVDNARKICDKSVKYKSIGFYYYIRTSRFLVFNARPNFDIKKRKNQRYIQTWHSSLGFKMIEKDAEDTLDKKYIKKAKKDSKYIDLLISGCKYRTECFRRNFWYNGEIAEFGTPRNDILFSKEKELIVKTAKTELGISENTKVILYAPTFRNSNNLSYITSLDVNRLLIELEKKFQGNWVLVYRLHPNVNFDNKLPQNIVDASNFTDMQTLLLMSDVLLTDYSSVMFDFMLLKRPIFLYASDHDEYISKERKVYFTVDELPFDFCITNDSLVSVISNFNYEDYSKKVKKFTDRIGTFECGLASKKVLEWIYKQ